MTETYEYPYGDTQAHDALADLDRRVKALETKPVEDAPEAEDDPERVEEHASEMAAYAGIKPVLANPFVITPAKPVITVTNPEVVA